MQADDIIKILLVIIFFVLPALGQLFGKLKEQQQKKAPPPAKPRDEPFRSEIEEFLRKASQGERPAPAAAEPKRKKPPKRTRPTPAAPVNAEVVETAGPVAGRVQEHVASYLDPSEFSRRSGQLGAVVAQADDQLEARLHGTFDHNVGSLGRGSSVAAKIGREGGDPQLLALLQGLGRDPRATRTAIILSEILRRPEERWTR